MKFQLNFPVINRFLFGLFLFLIIGSTASLSAQASYLKIAQSLERQQDYAQALLIYQQIYKSKKNDINVIRGIKNCYQGLQQYDQLISFLTTAQQTTPRNLYIPSYLGEVYYQTNQREKAMEAWQKHIETHKKDIAVYRIVASSMITMRLFDEAIAVYSQAMINIKSQHNLHLEIANLNKLQLKYAAATENLLKYYVANPRQFNYIQRQILNLADEKDQLPEIMNIIREFSTTYPKLNQIKEIQANLYIKEKNFEPAFEIYQQLDDEKSNGSYLAKFANSARASHAYEYALQAYYTIQSDYPESPFAQNTAIQIALAHKMLGYQKKDSGEFESAGYDIARAVSIYDSLSRNSNNRNHKIESQRQLGDIYAAYYYDLDLAIKYYSEYIKQQRKGVPRDEAIILLGDLYLKKNLLAEAKNTYAMVAGKEFKPTARYKHAEVLYYNGSLNKSLELLLKLQENLPYDHGLYNDILARKYVLESFRQDTIRLHQYASAELMLFQNKKSEAVKVFAALANANAKISSVAGRRAGKLYLELGKPEDAKTLYLFLQEKYPDDVHIDEILFYLAQSFEKLDDLDNALAIYSRLISEYDTSLFVTEARQKARVIRELVAKEKS